MKVKDLVKTLKTYNQEADIQFFVECYKETINKIGYIDTIYPTLNIDYRVADTGQQYNRKNTPVVFMHFNTKEHQVEKQLTMDQIKKELSDYLVKLLVGKYIVVKK